jgi:hypothetical protein
MFWAYNASISPFGSRNTQRLRARVSARVFCLNWAFNEPILEESRAVPQLSAFLNSRFFVDWLSPINRLIDPVGQHQKYAFNQF